MPTTFSEAGRDLSGWKLLKDIHASLFGRPETANLRVTISYDRQLPSKPYALSDISISDITDVLWHGIKDDDLDHFWEARRIERLAPCFRELVPSNIDGEGWADAECWIDLTTDGIQAHASRDNGDSNDSSILIEHRKVEGCWKTKVEISFAWDGADSDLLTLLHEDGGREELIEMIQDREWNIGDAVPIGARLENESIHIDMPLSVLRTIAN